VTPAGVDVRRGEVWQVRLERPARANALSAALVEDLLELLAEAERARPAALVLRGNARHFAAGFDLDGLAGESDGSLALRFLRVGGLLERVATLPCLTVAAVEGTAVGAGADLVAACDERLGATTARFRFPGAGFGVVLGTARLAALVGPAAAAYATGESVTAAEAHRSGLLTRAPVPPDLLDDQVEQVLQRWGRVHPTARAEVLAQARPPVAYDAALGALARSVAEPGLHDRVTAFAARTRPAAAAAHAAPDHQMTS